MCRDLGLKTIIIEGNSMCMINAVKDQSKIRWKINKLIMEAHGIFASFNHVDFLHTYHVGNRPTDALANKGTDMEDLVTWPGTCIPWGHINNLINEDIN